MAQLVLGIAGAAVGSLVGQPALGFAIGSTLGGMLFPTNIKSHQEGPRLGDLQVTASTYGQPIPVGYGCIRVSGNVIWATPIHEEKSTTTSHQGGGKGGGGGQTTTSTTYSYFADFAIAFTEGPAIAITRIWADGKLIYDVSGTSALVQQKGLVFHVYNGDETQLPDSLIEADKGVGNVPAYRGITYVVFNKLPLKDFGNRRPNITAEICFSTQASYTLVPVQYTEDTETYSPSAIGVYDSVRKLVYSSGGRDETSLGRFSVPTMQENFTVTRAQSVSRINDTETGVDGEVPNRLDVWIVDTTTGFIVGTVTCAFYNHTYKIVRIDPNSLTADLTFSAYGPSNSISAFVFPNSISIASAGGNQYVLCASQMPAPSESDTCIGVLNLADFSYVWHQNNITGILVSTPVPVDDKAAVVWVVHNSGVYDFYESTFPITTTSYIRGVPTVFTQPARFRLLFSLQPSALGATSLGSSSSPSIDVLNNFLYDPDTDSLLGTITTDIGGRAVSLDYNTGAVNWSTAGPYTSTGYAYSMVDPRIDMTASQAFPVLFETYSSTSAIALINKIDGKIEFIGQATSWGDGAGENYPRAAYDPVYQAVIGSNGLYFLNRIQNTQITLDTIVGDITNRAGNASFNPISYDASELSSIPVRGYCISRQTTLRDAISPLASAFFFDTIESDNQIKFLTKGRTSTRTIVQNRLSSNDKEDFLSQTRGQEIEMPMRITVAYSDFDRDYQQGTQYAKRTANPYPVMYSKNEISVELPIVFVGDEAKQIAEKTLYSTWAGRDRFQFTLAWENIDLDPSDVIEVALDEGTTYKVALSSVVLGADLSVQVSAKSEETTAYTSTVVGENNFVPGQIHSGDNTSVIKIHNLPLLSDLHDQLRSRSIVYYQAGPLFSSGLWTGCTVYRSSNTVDWLPISRTVNAMVYGVVHTALAPVDDVFAIDRDSSITLWPTAGGENLSSISEDQLVSGALNMMTIGDEIVNFQNVTVNDDGSYTIDTFLRGRRGTDVYANFHTSDEYFYILDTDTVHELFFTLSELTTPVYFKAVGDGLTVEEVPAVAFTPIGADLLPYAPVNAVRSDDDPSAGDITIGWTRRTRINGDLSSTTEVVPINEDAEAYEVEILDGTGGSVLRTLEADSETVLYEAADVVTDFGSPPATLYCRIYQMSAQVGRGFSYEFALEA